jgi:hypothetical protein
VTPLGQADFARGDLGRATEETARAVKYWRERLGDEQYVVYIAVFGLWFDHERGRVRYAAGRLEGRAE